MGQGSAAPGAGQVCAAGGGCGVRLWDTGVKQHYLGKGRDDGYSSGSGIVALCRRSSGKGQRLGSNPCAADGSTKQPCLVSPFRAGRARRTFCMGCCRALLSLNEKQLQL